jgi:hypothetical protein
MLKPHAQRTTTRRKGAERESSMLIKDGKCAIKMIERLDCNGNKSYYFVRYRDLRKSIAWTIQNYYEIPFKDGRIKKHFCFSAPTYFKRRQPINDFGTEFCRQHEPDYLAKMGGSIFGDIVIYSNVYWDRYKFDRRKLIEITEAINENIGELEHLDHGNNHTLYNDRIVLTSRYVLCRYDADVPVIAMAA